MPLNSDQLEAFSYVAKFKSFSKAASALNLSQPALSLRIKKLEEEIKTSLFIRDNAGVMLTDVGETVFRHYMTQSSLEKDLLENIVSSQKDNALRGYVRIAGFSTIMKSVLIPSLDSLVAQHPYIHIELHIHEMHELLSSLKTSQVDYAITEGPLSAENLENVLLGYEENILVESKSILEVRENHYFDNDPEDKSTFNFFKAQKKKKESSFRRNYLDEVYSIIEAVERGWGRAVLPKHLIKNNSKLRAVPGYLTAKAPIYLNYYRQPFYTRIHNIIQKEIETGFKANLSKS